MAELAALSSLDTCSDEISVYFRQEDRERALWVKDLLEDMLGDAAEEFGASPLVRVAFLRRTDWEQISDHPYGVAFVTPDGFMGVPADEDNELFMLIESLREDFSMESVARIESSGLSAEEEAKLSPLLAALHELGHLLARDASMVTDIRWLDELNGSNTFWRRILQRRSSDAGYRGFEGTHQNTHAGSWVGESSFSSLAAPRYRPPPYSSGVCRESLQRMIDPQFLTS